MEFKKKWITYDDLAKILSIKRLAIIKLVEEGKFPPPLRLSIRVVRWDIDKVNEWIAAREAERFTAPPVKYTQNRKSKQTKAGGQ